MQHRFLRILAPVLLVLAAPPSVSAQTASRPNILMIIVDDLNDYQGYLEDGHPQAETPNLDRLARNGTIFQNAHCTAPKSGPSRTSFLSGKTPIYTGMLNNDSVSPVFRDNFKAIGQDSIVFTLPEVLRDSGYYTVGINKVYFGWKNPGFDNDFDSLTADRCARDLSWNDYILFAPDQGLIDYQDEGIPGYIWSQIPDSIEPLLFDRAAADTALGILEAFNSDPGQFCNRPLFLSLGIFLPHKPLIIPDRHFRKDYLTPEEFFQEPFDPPYNIPAATWPPNGTVMPPQPDPIHADFYSLGPLGQDLAKGGNQAKTFEDWPDFIFPTKPVIDTGLTDEERDFMLSESFRANAVTAYLAGVRFADYQIGRVLTALEDLGIADNTIVIFVSDHGYSLGEKRHWHKFGPWETDMRVPLVIKDPQRGFGASVRAPVSTLDIFPTVLELTGIGEPKFPDGRRYLDGMSLVPYLDQPDLPVNRPTLGALRKPKGDQECFTTFSIRNADWHYIRYQGLLAPNPNPCDTASAIVEEELYHLGRYRDIDPDEHHNLADDPRYRDVRDYLSQWIADSAYYGVVPPTIEINTSELACGYAYTDTLRLSAELYDPAGVRYTGLPAVLDVRWHFSNAPGLEIINTKDLAIAVSDLMDLATYNAGEGFAVYAEAMDLTAGRPVAQDVRDLHLNAAYWPDNFLNADVQGNTVFIRDLDYVNQSQIRRYIWNFGDGTGSSVADPGSHRYAAPGTYTIKSFIEFGNDTANLCRRNFDRTVTIDALDFNDGVCMEPQNAALDVVGLDRAKITWNPVYGALAYQMRGRKRTGLDTAWQYRVLPANVAQLKRLESDQAYEFEVRTLCDASLGLSSVSRWSYPLWFTTTQCFPPRGVAVTGTSATTATISWQTNPAASFGYAVIYGTSATTLTTVPTAAGATSITLTGLDSATTYFFKVRSRCGDLFGGMPQPGPLGELLSFTTDGGAPRWADAQPGTELSVFPNPATAAYTVAWQHEGDGPVVVRVTDLLGRTLETRTVDGGAGFGQLTFHRGDLPAGVYLVSLQRRGTVATRPFTIAD